MADATESRGYEQFSFDGEALSTLTPFETGRARGTKLYSGDGVTVMSLALTAGAEIREHVAPVPILIQVLQGEAQIGVAGDEIEAASGAAVHIDANVKHEVRAVSDLRFLLLLLDRKPPARPPFRVG